MSPAAHWSTRAATVAVAVLYAALVLAPVASILLALDLNALNEALAQPRQWRLLQNTLALAVSAAALAALLGVLPGVYLAWPRRLSQRLLIMLCAVPLVLPPYIVAVAWVDLLGSAGLINRVMAAAVPSAASPVRFHLFSLAGAALVLSCTWFPLTSLTTALAWRRLDTAGVEASLLLAGPRPTLLALKLPALASGALSGALLVFLLALFSFSVPSLLQVQVFTVEVYTQFSSFYDTSAAIAAALALLLLGSLPLLAGVFFRPWGNRPATTTNPVLPPRRGIGATLLAATLLVLALAVLLPLLTLVRRALPLNSLLSVWHGAGNELATSLYCAAAAATAGVLLALALVLVKGRPWRPLFAASALGFLLSGPVIGVGLILAWNHPPPRAWVYDGFAILVVACLARYFIFAYAGLALVYRRRNTTSEEAALACGVSPRRTFTGITLPALAPILAAIWGILFVLALSELETVVLVAPPGWTPLSVRIFSLMHYGPGQLVAALALLTVLVTLAGAGAGLVLFAYARKLAHGRA